MKRFGPAMMMPKRVATTSLRTTKTSRLSSYSRMDHSITQAMHNPRIYTSKLSVARMINCDHGSVLYR